MTPCIHCGEDPGPGTRCQACGRVQYRYAVDDGTDDAVTATTASDAEQRRVDNAEQDETFEKLQELIAGSAPARPPETEAFRVHVPEPLSRIPDRAPVERPAQGPTSERQSSGLAQLISVAVFVALGVVFFAAVSDRGSFQDFDIRQLFIPALILFALFRRIARRNRRD